MKIVCAWCRQEIEDIPGLEGASKYEVSHGICEPCRDHLLANRKRALEEFLDRLSPPVLMINSEGEVMLANRRALQVLGKTLDAVSGHRGGDVMECVYARLPEGCGETVHCAACAIRRSVMTTFETGKSLKSVLAYLNRRIQDGSELIELLISTEKVKDVVLLRIDEMPER